MPQVGERDQPEARGDGLDARALVGAEDGAGAEGVGGGVVVQDALEEREEGFGLVGRGRRRGGGGRGSVGLVCVDGGAEDRLAVERDVEGG